MDSAGQSAADPYQYDQLYSSNTIRLADLLPGSEPDPIHVILRQIELPDDPDTSLGYTALSYTWGPPNPLFPIWVEGKPCHVRLNLLDALRHLRHHRIIGSFWIDALCINQMDVYEKNHQVSLMARIYRSAQAARVWLGISEGQSQIALQNLVDECENDACAAKMPATTLPVSIQSLASLLKRDYWSRVWIIQEFLLARVIDLQCGRAVVSWGELGAVCLKLQHFLPSGPAIDLMKQRTFIIQDETMLQQQTLESLIRTYSKSECCDSRDRIFALLSLAADCASGNGIKPDYGLPRFGLLVQTLDFCRPKDPVEFISFLLRVLQKEKGDDQWAKVVEIWNQGIFSPLVQGWQPGQESNEAFVMMNRCRVTHLVTASSFSRDWVRHHSFLACIRKDTVLGRYDAHSNFLGCAQETPTLKGYENLVYRIDEANIAVRLHQAHFALLSLSEIAAMRSPCTALWLHPDSQRCTGVHCAKLSESLLTLGQGPGSVGI